MSLPDSAQVFYTRALGHLETSAAPVTVLDVGCGRGVHALYDPNGRAFYQLAHDKHVLWGTDPDPIGDQHPLLHRYTQGDGTRLPFEDHSVDLVVFDWVMEHVEDPESFAAELVRVARPGGRILYRTLQRWSPAGIGARLVPNRFHPQLIGRLQPAMKSHDVYPTTVRANTVAATRELFDPYASCIETVRCAGLAGYVPNKTLSRAASRLEAAAPGWFAHGLVVDVTLHEGT